MNSMLKDNLVCPACHGSLTWSATDIHCEECSGYYPIVDGIPVLLESEATLPEHTNHALQQAAFYDQQVDAEWEITRPHGAPRLYRWFLEEKFRRSIRGLEPILSGATVLTVCGGSGMEAEFLARAGARVISSDISLGAAQRTRTRAERSGLEIVPLVTAVERLPFRDRSIDLVYVHDGLHHTETPIAGVREMARVAKRAVSITEPAQAFLTSIAVRLGLSPDYAAAGNRIARLVPSEVQIRLIFSGLTVVRTSRYAMYYKWQPGPYMEMLSRPGLFQVACAVVLLINLLVGRWGNKFVITASYPPDTATRTSSSV